MKLTQRTIILIIYFSICSNVQAQNWQEPSYIFSGNGTGAESGNFFEAVAVNGHPAIAYTDETHNNIMYVRSNDSSGTSWGIPVIIDTFNISANGVSMTVVNGNPAIVYNGAGNTLKYKRASDVNGTTWQAALVIVPDLVIFSFCLAEVNGFPAVAYSYSNLKVLRFVKATNVDGTLWGASVLVDSSGYFCDYPSVKILNGNPAIGFFNATDEDLMFVRATNANGTAWGTVDTVQSSGEVGNPFSMEIVNGRPAFAYCTITNTQLNYIRATNATGSAWGNPVLLDPFAGSQGVSLRIINGFPAVTYSGSIADGFYYLRATNINGTAWGTQIPVGNTGQVFTSKNGLTVINGKPKIVFRQFNPVSFYFQSALDISGNSWDTPVQIQNMGANGTHSSLKIILGKPAFAYLDSIYSDLRYMHASDTSGFMPWQPPVVVDGTAGSGYGNKLEIVNGHPAIAYVNYGSNAFKLKFVRAVNATGTVWGAPVLLDSIIVGTNQSNNYISLAMVNDTPSVSYYNPFSNRLMFIRANDPDGSFWNSPVAVDTIGSTGLFNSLVDVNGRPAIAYYNASNTQLKYVRANNGSGTSWGTSLALSSGGNVGKYASMCIVNGFPAIAALSPAVLFFRAADSDGTIWNSPVTTNVGGVGGSECQLSMAHGHPAVACLSGFNTLYCRANDTSGTSWGAAETVYATLGSSLSFTANATKAFIIYYNNNEATALFFSKTLACTPPSATITYSGSPAFCTGDSVILNAPVAANRSYEWKRYGVTIPGATLSSYTALTGGTYKVTVTNTITGCTKTTPSGTTLIVHYLPNAIITSLGPTTFCAGDSVTLKANSGAGLTYIWKKNGNNISGATNIYYVADSAGGYKVRVTNINGCTKISTGVTVTVPCRLSETENESLFDVNIFPNPAPADFIINIQNGNYENNFIAVYDMTGRMILSEETFNRQFKISGSLLQSGIYSTIITNRDNMKILKLVKSQ